MILATTVTQPGIATERDTALEMLDTLEKNGLSKNIQTITADKGYGTTGLFTELIDRGITPHIPLLAKDNHEAEPFGTPAPKIQEHRGSDLQNCCFLCSRRLK